MGEHVRIFARPSSPEKQRDDYNNIVWGDIRDLDAVERAVNGVDYPINLVSNFRKGGSDKSDAYDVNVVGTENVLKASLKNGVKRLVHCSTIDVHGNELEIPVKEDTPFNLGDLYHETKLVAERKVWEFNNDANFALVVIFSKWLR